MNDNLKIVIAAIVLLAAITATCFWYIGNGCKKCPVCPEIKDSTTRAPACTVYVPTEKIVVKESIRYLKDTVRETDTLVVNLRADTGTTAEIDTTMHDGAKIGVTIRAKLIIPPVDAAIRYTPAPDTLKHVIYPRDTIRKRTGLGVTIGGGWGAMGLAEKRYVPDFQITLGWSWLP